MGDRKRPRIRRRGGEVRRRLEHAEDVRLLEDDAGGVLGRPAQHVRLGRPVAVRNLDDVEPESRRVGLHDLTHLWVRRLGDDDLRATRRVLRHEARVGGDGRAVVPGGVRDVHPGQLADRGLVLEDRLQHALAQLRLIRRVRGQELAALQDGVDDGGHVVVVKPGAEEGNGLTRVRVRLGELLEVGRQLLLGERGRQIERAPEPHPSRDVGKELLDGRDADRLEHRVAIAIGQREVAHGRSSCTTAVIPARRGGDGTPRRPSANRPRRARSGARARASPRRKDRH